VRELTLGDEAQFRIVVTETALADVSDVDPPIRERGSGDTRRSAAIALEVGR
jgi:hypothetical protein